MKRDLFFITKVLVSMFLISSPFVAHIAIKSTVEKEGRRIRSIEASIVRTKKSINNLEKIFSERIDYKKIEKKAKSMGFDYINRKRNRVFVIRD